MRLPPNIPRNNQERNQDNTSHLLIIHIPNQTIGAEVTLLRLARKAVTAACRVTACSMAGCFQDECESSERVNYSRGKESEVEAVTSTTPIILKL